MSKDQIKHPIVVLQPIRSELDVIFGKGTIIDLDKITRPVLKRLRQSWNQNPLSLGGDIIYLFNQNLPWQIPDEEKEI